MGIRDVRFGPKVGWICTKLDESGKFSDQISVHMARICPIWGQSDPLRAELDIATSMLPVGVLKHSYVDIPTICGHILNIQINSFTRKYTP